VGELVPLDEAIKQAAAVLGMEEEAVAKLAAKAGRTMQLMADAEAAGLYEATSKIMFGGVDLTPYIEQVSLGSDMPHNPANRRTFRLGGKPYHYVQAAGRLETQPGESPWT
jgi:hypothetical protein